LTESPRPDPASSGMFIRRARTRNKATGEAYFTYRIVASRRTGKQVRQVTLLNLGRHFDLPQPDWPRLCTRIVPFPIPRGRDRLEPRGGMGWAEMAGRGNWDEVARHGGVDRGRQHRLHV
jgi:hypothetical protein